MLDVLAPRAPDSLSRRAEWLGLFALVALFALAILFGLSGADYATRTIHPTPWVAPNGY